MVKKYSFGQVFRTESVPSAMQAEKGQMPHMTVNEEKMSLTYRMASEDVVYGLGEMSAGSIREAGSTRASAATNPGISRTAGPFTRHTISSYWTAGRHSACLSIIRAF